MPRYFFDVHDEGDDVLDTQGMLLPDLEAARLEATRALIGIAQDVLPADGPQQSLSISIRDETGSVVLTVVIDYRALRTSPPEDVHGPA